MLYGHRTQKYPIIAAISQYVVFADWIFTAPSAVVQLVTGLWLVYVAGYSFTSLWIWGSLAGYALAGICWVPVVYLQLKCGMMQFSPIKQTGNCLSVITGILNTGFAQVGQRLLV